MTNSPVVAADAVATPPAPCSDASAARALGARVARPTAARRDHDRRWSPHLFAELAAAEPGVLGALVPRGLGGAGLSAAATFDLLAGLGEGARDPGFALMVGVQAVLSTAPLRAFGTADQQARYLPGMVRGDRIGAVSLRQTQGAALAPTISARRAETPTGGWVLTGELDLVAGAPVAHHFLIVAEHDDGARTAFLVDGAAPGLLVVSTEPVAMPTCPWGRLVLGRVHVPDTAVLGAVGGAPTGTEPLLAALDWVFTSAPWLGVLRALTDDARTALRERRVFGRPLAHDQSARFTLADLAARVELTHGLLRRAARRFDTGGGPARQDAAAARLFTAAAARTVVDGAARLVGPDDPAGDHLVERAHRDARFFAETGGGAAVLRAVIASHHLDLG
ncbi:acyl-CoA dehydrogenase family protein [Nocardia takedensis]|uniref:acyl-CoA dehydrogenase family protein n=1 Tax=Nocardia takedensis TaxID=259390 RepID=UPI0002E76539|nr:acyl-CoA dehydrogenase family protein [Nocardia takedensis]